MVSFLRRLFKFGQSEAHAALDQLEDPIKMTEQGIRDLKRDLEMSLKSLAEVRAMQIRTGNEAEVKQQLSGDYETKACALLERAKKGEIGMAEAERLATEALTKKEEAKREAVALLKEVQSHDAMVAKLQGNCERLKEQTRKWENELRTLKARYKVGQISKKLNKEMAKIDPNGTITMLEKMKEKVSEEESLAHSYGEMAQAESGVEEEINRALEGGKNPAVSDSLAAIKKKIGI